MEAQNTVRTYGLNQVFRLVEGKSNFFSRKSPILLDMCATNFHKYHGSTEMEFMAKHKRGAEKWTGNKMVRAVLFKGVLFKLYKKSLLNTFYSFYSTKSTHIRRTVPTCN